MKRKVIRNYANATKTPAKVIALNALQFVGVLSASLVIPSPETMAVLAMLPDPVAGNIGKIALALVAIKPALNFFSDILDNGKIDDSYRNQ